MSAFTSFVLVMFVVKATMETRAKAVILYEEKVYSAGESRRRLAGMLQQAFITTKSILTGTGNYSKSGQRFVQQMRAKIVVLYS